MSERTWRKGPPSVQETALHAQRHPLGAASPEGAGLWLWRPSPGACPQTRLLKPFERARPRGSQIVLETPPLRAVWLPVEQRGEWSPCTVDVAPAPWPSPQREGEEIRPDWSRSVLGVVQAVRGHRTGSSDPLPDYQEQVAWLRERVSPRGWRLPESAYDAAVRGLAQRLLEESEEEDADS